MSEVHDFKTPDEIKSVYEQDRPFELESRGETLGRLAWLRTRSEAEFLLFLADLGVPTRVVPHLMNGLSEILLDYDDFVHSGIKKPGERGHPSINYHPSDVALEDLLEETVESAKRDAVQKDPEYQRRIDEVHQALDSDEQGPIDDEHAALLAEGAERLETGQWSNLRAANFFAEVAGLSDEALFDKLRQLGAGWTSPPEND